jgi:hypothetical protein
VNYRVAQWKQAHIPIFDVPPATSHGWIEGDDGHLEPLWSDGPVLPPSIVWSEVMKRMEKRRMKQRRMK